MSIRDILEHSVNQNPLGMKEALEEELQARIAVALQEKIANGSSDQEEMDDDDEDEDEDEDEDLDEAAVVTHKWYSTKHWKDGSDHFDNLDDALYGYENGVKHPAMGNTSRKRPDHHIGIPVKAKKAIAYMNKYGKPVNESLDFYEELEDDMDEAACVREMKKLHAAACPKNEMYKKCNEKYGCTKEKFNELYASYCSK